MEHGSQNAIDDISLREVELSQNEKNLRSVFAEEYVKDYCVEKAALRCGFSYAFAKDFGLNFLREGYTQRLIEELESSDRLERSTEIMRNRVMHQLVKESNVAAKSSERISALALLTKVLDMESAPEKDAPLYPGGVMIVPAFTTPEAWAEMASKSQTELKASVRE